MGITASGEGGNIRWRLSIVAASCAPKKPRPTPFFTASDSANKSSVIEACKYLGDYFVNNEEFKDLEAAKKYWGVVLELVPDDNQANAFFQENKM